MSDVQTIAPWAKRQLELVESEGTWAGLGAWREWATQNWPDIDIDGEPDWDTVQDIAIYALCGKLVEIADTEIERLRAAAPIMADGRVAALGMLVRDEDGNEHCVVGWRMYADGECWLNVGSQAIRADRAREATGDMLHSDEHRYEPFTTRDGSTACRHCHGTPGQHQQKECE